jgi:hypothetical protein
MSLRMLSYPDDRGDADSGQVLGALQPVGILLGRRPARQAEAEEDHRAGGHVRQVVDRIAQQPDRTGQHGEQQLGQAGGTQAERADRDGPVSLPSLGGVVADPRERERRRRVTLPEGLVHPVRLVGTAC